MDFLPSNIDEYVANHCQPESDLLRELNRETHLKVLSPRMLSGHVQGRFLSIISKLIRPNFILEIGTYTGYSAICLSEGLSVKGKLLTVDNNYELTPILDKYLMKSPRANQIEYKIANAQDVIPAINEKIDLVFIDADKENYLNYYNLVFDKVSTGGIILVDNVLWSGKVVQPVKTNDKSTMAILEFNNFIKNDNRVEANLIPIRDGIYMIRKK